MGLGTQEAFCCQIAQLYAYTNHVIVLRSADEKLISTLQLFYEHFRLPNPAPDSFSQNVGWLLKAQLLEGRCF